MLAKFWKDEKMKVINSGFYRMEEPPTIVGMAVGTL